MRVALADLQRALEFKDQPQVVAKARAALGLSAQAGGGTTAPSMRRVWAGKGVDTSGAVSPDGRTIAYVDPDTGALSLHGIESGVNRRLTSNGNEEWAEFAESAVFSPDASQIAYGWFSKNKRFEIRMVDARGTGVPNARTLVDRPDIEWINVTDWSRDGKWLAVVYDNDGAGGQTKLARISVADGAVQDLRAPLDSRPTRLRFSPDGRFIAFDVLRNKSTDDRDIVIRSLSDQTESYVAPAPGYDSLMGWSPDGTMLVFASDRHRQAARRTRAASAPDRCDAGTHVVT